MDPPDEFEIVCVAMAARYNRSGPHFPFHDLSTAVAKRRTKIFWHDRPLASVVNRQGDESSAVPTRNDGSFVTTLVGEKVNRSRRDGRDACARSVSAASS